jgi:gamma-glutamyltranspeptidase/glutathione hydrolase
VLEALASEGRDVFYDGWIAERIVAELEYEGGVMTRDDLAAHRGEWVEPISIRYGDYDVWECPPNGQGLAALLALNAYGQVRGRETASAAEALHAQVEAMRLAFADAARFVADPAFAPAPLAELLSTQYAVRRAALIDPGRAMDEAGPGLPATTVGDDTVYFSVVDAEGNGCSFINSNFMGFGTGIVPQGCGFSLQNRGRGFVLDAGHANALMPGKRPYHTIIPGLLTHASGDLAAVFGVMGGMMQPQGHLQVVSHLIDAMLDPQSALDAPRFQLADGDPDGTLLVEDSTAPDLVHALEERGHRVTSVSGTRRATFGLGQIIASGGDGVLWAGSDPRGDGHAGGF